MLALHRMQHAVCGSKSPCAHRRGCPRAGYSLWSNRSFKAPVVAGAVACLAGNVLYCLSYDARALWMLLLSRFVMGFGAPTARPLVVSSHFQTSAKIYFLQVSQGLQEECMLVWGGRATSFRITHHCPPKTKVFDRQQGGRTGRCLLAACWDTLGFRP